METTGPSVQLEGTPAYRDSLQLYTCTYVLEIILLLLYVLITIITYFTIMRVESIAQV